ncbi:cubilin [Penaeus vannamei]|uniref:Cubilin n=1 Tax=Penaeus vannamei TaxID=6689 RepID=A0A423TMG4_PENVA|nr:cubilin [Penaeus vannamei]
MELLTTALLLASSLLATAEGAFTSCGGVRTNAEGIIKSPRYPKAYPHNSRCVFEVKASPDAVIKFTCKKFILQASLGCSKDYVKVNGLVYCEETAPRNVFSNGGLTVEFSSDAIGRKKGFTSPPTSPPNLPSPNTPTSPPNPPPPHLTFPSLNPHLPPTFLT